MSTTTQAPGWYPDPENPAAQRWWSGSQWSAHTRRLGTPPTSGYLAAVAQAAPRRMTYVQKEREVRRVNPCAYSAVLLGLLGLVIPLLGVLGIPSIVLAAVGLGRAAVIRRTGARVHGTVAASIGLCLGVLLTLREAIAFVLGFLQGAGLS